MAVSRRKRAEKTVDWAQHSGWRAPEMGGLADGRRAADFDRASLIRGSLVELEHTADPLLALRIAMDHLTERADYYVLLERLESTPRTGRRYRRLLRNRRRYPVRNGASVVVIRAGRVLAITSGDNLRDLNLPGGGVEPGEHFADAARRELAEETQVDASGAELIPIHHRRGPEAESVAYVALGRLLFPPRMFSRPFEGHVTWARPGELLTPACRHAGVNLITFGRLGLV